MRKRWIVGMLALTSILGATVAYGGPSPEKAKPEFSMAVVADPGLPGPRQGIGGKSPAPVPEPIEPEPGTAHMPPGFQMVGYTLAKLPANRGALNMARACQLEFEGSRLCTVDEVLASVVVPSVPQGREATYAWVRSAGTVAQSLGVTRDSVSGSDPVLDCHGWTSDSRLDSGVAMALGSEHGCYGGFAATPCDAELALACCVYVAP